MTTYRYTSEALDAMMAHIPESAPVRHALAARTYTLENPDEYRPGCVWCQRDDGVMLTIRREDLEPVTKENDMATAKKTAYRAHTESWVGDECDTLDAAIKEAIAEPENGPDDCWIERDGERILTVQAVTTYHLVPEPGL